MKSIVTINTEFPSVDGHIDYLSGESLRDYDVAIFDPKLPYFERVNFNGGGSCLTIEATRSLTKAITHWSGEIRNALQAGKTVFFLLNEFEEDLGATGYESKARNQMSYNTVRLNNYQALPFSISVKNTKGRRISAVDSAYKPLLNTISELTSYRVIFENTVGQPIYSTTDGGVVGSIAKYSDLPGHLVFLPYFNLTNYDKASRDKWSDKATHISHGIVAQLIAIDNILRLKSAVTPAPQWIASAQPPKAVLAIDTAVGVIDADIADLTTRKEEQLEEKVRLLSFSRLLYENGKALETAIEDGLRALGFTVENFRDGDLEIDHIIVGSSGIRMIGESEGKDTSAIDISKFRQLESNINEDFQRDNVEEPAKGVLFGNGFRFTEPNRRAEQFTAKCLTNAKRLQTALVRTSDLYEAVIYALDHPDDETFRTACRSAIENTHGEVVIFPKSRAGTELDRTTA